MEVRPNENRTLQPKHSPHNMAYTGICLSCPTPEETIRTQF